MLRLATVAQSARHRLRETTCPAGTIPEIMNLHALTADQPALSDGESIHIGRVNRDFMSLPNQFLGKLRAEKRRPAIPRRQTRNNLQNSHFRLFTSLTYSTNPTPILIYATRPDIGPLTTRS